MTSEDQWIEIPASIFKEDGVVMVLESAETDLIDVMHALQDGTYAKAFVMDDGVSRSLQFDFSALQSEMSIDEPNELSLAYTRKMMAFLLFHPQPKHVAIVGLGGGSMTKFCYQQLPRTRVTTLEIDEHVIKLSELFEIPPPDKFKNVIHADAAEYFSTTDELFDVVLLDGCDSRGTAPIFCKPDFLELLRGRLQTQGMVVMNLSGMHERLTEIIQTVEACFSTQVLLLDVKESHNKILFAFHSSHSTDNWADIRRVAKILAERHGLDFPKYARSLQREGLSANHHDGATAGTPAE